MNDRFWSQGCTYEHTILNCITTQNRTVVVFEEVKHRPSTDSYICIEQQPSLCLSSLERKWNFTACPLLVFSTIIYVGSVESHYKARGFVGKGYRVTIKLNNRRIFF